MKKLVLLLALFQIPWITFRSPRGADPSTASTVSYGYAQIVDAIQLERPAPHPCNLNTPAPNGSTITTASGISATPCLTGPEKYWTCTDKKRVLLTSEDNKHFCMKVQFD